MPAKRRSFDYYTWILSHLDEDEDPDFERLSFVAKREGFVSKQFSLTCLALTLKLAWNRWHKYSKKRVIRTLNDFNEEQEERQREELNWLRAEKKILECLIKRYDR